MAMVALNFDRTAVVDTGSLQARWMVQEGEVGEFMKEARKHPKMQELMRAQEATRLEDEVKSAERAAAEAARAKRRA